MAARSEGIFPREGVNLDSAFAIDDTGSTDTPVNLRNARTIRLILVDPQLTGDALLAVEIYGEVVYGVDATQLAADKDPNGMVILHIRGFSLPTGTDVASYQLLPNTGTASIGGVFIELVDGPAR